ncbi:MAG TPA: hypothetical protein VL179_12550, partial [Mycobacterium sp.]|nr:hypothetical protein [Mycobacterium sp.]
SVVGGPGQIPAGVATGVRLPLKAPIGAAVVAHRDDRARAGWLASAEDSHRSAFEDVLEQVRKNGVAVFGLGDADPKVLDVLGEVAELLARHPQRGALRVRVFELLVGLGGTPYSAAQLADPGPLSISYLVAPIFDAEGRAMYELQLGPLRPEVSAAEREHYVQELKATAAQLSRH